jgi:hypothetical protein
MTPEQIPEERPFEVIEQVVVGKVRLFAEAFVQPAAEKFRHLIDRWIRSG